MVPKREGGTNHESESQITNRESGGVYDESIQSWK